MTKRYSFTTEEKAKELISLLELEEGQTVSNEIAGIYELIKQSKTYDVDIFWQNEPLEEFEEFEVNPKTPNHKFA